MIKKVLILLCLSIVLAATGFDYSLHTVQAESVSDLHNDTTSADHSTIPANPLSPEPKVPNVQGTSLSITDQLKRVSLAIQENLLATNRAENESKAMEMETEKLKLEIKALQDTIDKRTTVLKDRALAYQQSEKHITYLEVLIGATSLSDFLDRVGAIAAIAEADRTIIEQQEEEQKEVSKKKAALESKLTDLAALKGNLESRQEHLEKQQSEYKHLKVQIDQELKQRESVQFSKEVSSNTGNDYIRTVINAGKKYIGNSDYVFGGGRTANDIASGRFDCSGFVHWAFAQAGFEIGRNTAEIKNDGKQVSAEEIQPGDLVFFDTYKRDGHVGIYIGDGKFIGSQSSTGVAIADMTQGYWKNAFKGRVVRI